jgi:hypothetical protein
MDQLKHVLIVGAVDASANALSRALASEGAFLVTQPANAIDVMARTQARQRPALPN